MGLEMTEADVRRYYENHGLPLPDWLKPEKPAARRKYGNNPTESAEQRALFEWAARNYGAYPELRLMYHVPNGGSRTKAEAGRFRAEGVKRGVPDICLPVARGRYHGMYVELKRIHGGRLSPEQADWLMALQAQGYYAIRCDGWEIAAGEIETYLGGAL